MKLKSQIKPLVFLKEFFEKISFDINQQTRTTNA